MRCGGCRSLPPLATPSGDVMVCRGGRDPPRQITSLGSRHGRRTGSPPRVSAPDPRRYVPQHVDGRRPAPPLRTRQLRLGVLLAIVLTVHNFPEVRCKHCSEPALLVTRTDSTRLRASPSPSPRSSPLVWASSSGLPSPCTTSPRVRPPIAPAPAPRRSHTPSGRYRSRRACIRRHAVAHQSHRPRPRLGSFCRLSGTHAENADARAFDHTAQGLSEPAGALFALQVLQPIFGSKPWFLSYTLCSVAGLMIAVSVVELIPEVRACPAAALTTDTPCSRQRLCTLLRPSSCSLTHCRPGAGVQAADCDRRGCGFGHSDYAHYDGCGVGSGLWRCGGVHWTPRRRSAAGRGPRPPSSSSPLPPAAASGLASHPQYPLHRRAPPQRIGRRVAGAECNSTPLCRG